MLGETAALLGEQGQRSVSLKGFLGSVLALQASACWEGLVVAGTIFVSRMVSANFQCGDLSK